MWWTSGCVPVAIDDAQTGVSDGKVEIAAAVRAGVARGRRAPASPRRLSKTAGVRPSITIRTRPFAHDQSRARIRRPAYRPVPRRRRRSARSGAAAASR